MKIEFSAYLIILFLQGYFFWKTRKKINIFSNIFSQSEQDFSLDDEEAQENPKASLGEFWVGATRKHIFNEEAAHKIYRCKVNPENENEAYFYLSDDPRIKEIYFENVGERIHDVAKVEGYFSEAVSIITIKPGILNRDGDDWMFMDEAIVKFVDNHVYNQEYKKIIKSIKNYIGYNAIAIPLLSDARKIVESHIDKLEDEINRSITTPLYLGLMGTILGILIGLFGYSEGTAGTAGITALIGSVKWAMIFSFAGLALTVWNSTMEFSGAKNKLEETKERFCIFLRNSGKFPVMKDDFASALKQMQENLVKFNDSFCVNLDKKGAEYKDSLKILVDSLPTLQKVLLGINTTVGGFEKFSDKFKSVDEYLHRIKDLMDKISSFEHFKDAAIDLRDIATKIESNNSKVVEDNSKLLKFLNDSIKNLEEIERVATIAGNRASESISKLESDSEITNDKAKEILLQTKNHLDQRIDEIKTISNNAEADVKKVLNETKNSFIAQTHDFIENIADTNTKVAATFSELAQNIKGMSPDQWKNNAVIGQIEGLTVATVKSVETIHESMEQLKSKIKEEIKKETKSSENVEIEKSIEALNQNMAMQLEFLKNIKENSKPRSIFMIIKDFIGI
ncbi:MAG: methyl-accepting chemotaxis protein [Fibromonadaceae bacterium]|jgi:hypothetical protein|nr:methyl-accepting chemotaxis protein [Fibromonadaceae bacterium]